MDKQALLTRIDKIFRANIIEKDEICGQFDQTRKVKVIGDIEELKSDIKDLIRDEFKIGLISPDMVFVGNRKIGASYDINEAIEIAKKWGFTYVAWNGGRLWTIKCEETDIYYNELF
jgi:hypothetical protein